MTEEMIKYLLDNAVDGQYVVITDYENEQNVICKDGSFSFELEDAIAIRDDLRELYMGADTEVNVYMVQHGITGDYGQFINELIYFEQN